ncbi:MAG: fumarylacetoacetate hydrolase family protein [Anaerolineales bacterium]|nr:fumarylacetoacetate hydrolase family protein [Anaerolineales bacterium]
MRFVTFQHKENIRLGALLEDRVVDLQQAHLACSDHARQIGEPWAAEAQLPVSMHQLLAGEQASLEFAQKTINFIQEQLDINQQLPGINAFSYFVEDVILYPPVVQPGKIICVGMNYPSPATSSPVSHYPVLFLKAASTLTGHKQPIVLPRVSQDVFCEGELAVVIGRRGKHIPPERALSHVAGYTIANDVGARDLEARTSQWATGKLPDTFSPIGPALVTRDEVPDPNALTIKTTLNEQLVQYGNTGDMIFDMPYLISYLSGIAALEPGDIILTGSPKAVGDRPAPKVTLKPGDTITIDIEKLGTLINTTVAEE